MTTTREDELYDLRREVRVLRENRDTLANDNASASAELAELHKVLYVLEEASELYKVGTVEERCEAAIKGLLSYFDEQKEIRRDAKVIELQLERCDEGESFADAARRHAEEIANLEEVLEHAKKHYYRALRESKEYAKDLGIAENVIAHWAHWASAMP